MASPARHSLKLSRPYDDLPDGERERPRPTVDGNIPDMKGTYDRYISSGLYDRRYPRPNRQMLALVLSRLPDEGRFLDVGAGTGRYTLPLLQRTRASGVASDISASARQALERRAKDFIESGRLSVRDGDIAALSDGEPQSFDLAVLAFGVLGHIAGRTARQQLLGAVRKLLKPGGTLVLSLPNAARRFRREQRAAAGLVRAGSLEPGDIVYVRGGKAEELRLFYHLFTPAEARRDLAEQGFSITRMGPESMLSERTVVANPLLGLLDAMVCRFLPAALGYGFMIVSEPEARGSE